MVLTPHQVRSISVAAFRDDRTVRACYSGKRVQPTVRDSIVAAARALNLPEPPPPSTPRTVAA